jgi:hypothetical protein
VTEAWTDPLVREGWSRQFTASEPRLSEAVAAYEEAGYEVRLEPLPQEPDCGECRVCFERCEERYRVIYTRPKGAASPSDEDSFG